MNTAKTFTVKYSLQSSGHGRYTSTFKVLALSERGATGIAKSRLNKMITNPRLISVTEEA